ncbi:hypothetical protein BOO69_07335 [Sulfitobacter alexandrii]|uniref:Integrase n=2 Tax=Sulfitobacter alexandrii TaxID=1917485 RepID=A0A1J0WG10_9RHOB|nr:hypothetical protein BOO69_07335 [Sulfitobacter alexandrii]
MQVLLDHPEIEALSDTEIRVLEGFMRFCAEHRLADPNGGDVRAWCRLDNVASDSLPELAAALRRLGVGSDLLNDLEIAHSAQDRKARFRGVPKGATRTFKRVVSVPLADLPDDWQRTLRRLRFGEAYAPSIMTRMESRLGMFVWSAKRAGCPVDLADTVALRALYSDLRDRSITRQRESARKRGLKDDVDTPRWAYLRSTWEELRRFACAHGMPDELWDKLTVTYSVLVTKEGRQAAEKFAKAEAAGTRTELLKNAEAMLVLAGNIDCPHIRHAMRNRAAAIALGCGIPARSADVLVHHRFGVGISYEPHRNAYRFRYTANKTAGSTGVRIDVPLLPWWNKFIDALILQDDDPRYLGSLRAMLIAQQRPLYVHYDGTPATYAWYSRMWSIVTGTGGHIARTLIYDDAIEQGAEGIQYARLLNGHAPTSPIVQSYESERLRRERVLQAQSAMAVLFGDDEEDLADWD